MSALSGLGGSTIPPTSSISSRADSTNPYDAITSDEFMSMMLTELTNQDPTEPQDTQKLLEQIGAIRSIESETGMIDQLGSLVSQNEFAGAANLIGTVISGINETNQRVADFVLSVSQTADGAVLNLVDGSRVRMKDVDEVIAPIADDPSDDEADDDTDGDPI